MTASSFPIQSARILPALATGVEASASAFLLHGVERKRHLTSRAICHRPIPFHAGTGGMGHFLAMSKHAAIRKSGFIKPIRLKFARTAIRVCRNDCNRAALRPIIKHLQQPPRIGGVVNRFPFEVIGHVQQHDREALKCPSSVMKDLTK